VGQGRLESGDNGEEHTIIPVVGGGGFTIPGTAATDISTLTGTPSLANYLAQLGASGYGVPPGGLGSTSGGGGGGQSKGNPKYNAGLFGEYKTRKDENNRAIRSKDIRAKIKSGELPALPPSKVDPSISMCLAWHTKGMCNPDCPCARDHEAEYSNEEYKPLKSWCATNYPGQSS
jgi:hypothetical protein